MILQIFTAFNQYAAMGVLLAIASVVSYYTFPTIATWVVDVGDTAAA
jgi:hypothetical protein